MTKARAHLKRLGLESLTNRPKLQELGGEVRKLLSAPFLNITDYCRANMNDGSASGDCGVQQERLDV